MSDHQLTPRQEAFVREFLIDLNATQAAIRAGYSEATAKQQGSRLLTNANVASAIAAGQSARAERTEITADYVLNGIQELVERCIQAQQVVDDEGKPTGEYKFEASAALRGYELLGKHLGLFPNKVDLSVTDQISGLIEQARRRAAKAQVLQ